jgi:hypothetical protein
MSPRKFSPIIPLAIGVLCIGIALVGGIIAFTKEDETGKKPKVAVEASARKPSKAKRRPAAAEKFQPPPVVEKEPPTPAELRQQTTRILIARIKKTPTELNQEWLAQYMRFIRTEADLDLFFDEYLGLGQKRTAQYKSAQKASKKILPQDPRYFIGQATSVLVAKDNTERMLLRGVKDNMAQALYKEQEESEGIENVEETFMGNFFKKLLRMYTMLEAIEQQGGGDSVRWLDEHVRTLEAAVMDRYLRVERRLALARQQAKDSMHEGHLRAKIARTDNFAKAINENLLLLGKVYHQAAARKVIDRKMHEFYTDQAFYLLAMICQRVGMSPDALNVLREINDIQRNYLHRQARTSWKRAQLAMAAGEADKAGENFFVANQRYLQAMAQSAEGRREEIAVEFAILKKEIAQWKSRVQTAEAAVEAEL